MPITFPTTPLTGKFEIALGVDPASDPAGWSWTDITQWVRYNEGISITLGRPDESATVDASKATLRLDNRDGRFSRRNPLSPYYGQLSKNTPIRLGVNPGDGVHYRYYGFVNEWPTRWDKSGNDSTVPITCSGILRRLARNRRLGSALFRAMSGVSEGDFRPVAYLPMEDGSDASVFSAGLAGGPTAAYSGDLSLAAYSGAVGSSSVPTMGSGGYVKWVLPSSADTQVWQVQFMASLPTQPGADARYLEISQTADGGGVVRVRFAYDASTSSMSVRIYNGAGTELNHASVPFTAIALDTPYMWAITSETLAGSVFYILSQFDQNGNSVQSNNTFVPATTAVGVPYSVEAFSSSDNSGWALGHIGVYTDPAILTSPNVGPNAYAISGFTSERAGDRMNRLCREEGVSFQLTGNANTTPRMGPQQNGTLLDLLRDCETADQGILYENQFGLGFIAQSQRYNLASSLDLDFNAADIAEPPEPADDDQQTVNSYTASRTGGSSATFEDSEAVTADGLYASSGTFNVATDESLPDIASWRLHLGTVNDDRWPAIAIRLANTPSRITAWVAMTIGARITAANPPDQGAPDTIDAVVEGWTETISPDMWEAVLNTSPTRPFEVVEIADQTFGPIETAGCIVNNDATSGATSLKLHTHTGPVWATSASRPGDFPRELTVTGEKVRATAMGSLTAATFFASGLAATGVNAAVTPALPAGHAQWDLLLLVAAVQNTGTGTVDTPAGYTRLASSPSGNVRVFAKIDNGAEVAPTVTFTGSAATSDTIAKTFGFRDMCADLNRIVHNSATQANASAQNITIPALQVRQDNCLVLFIGWKADDWTNAASPSGFTEIQDSFVTAGDDMGITVAYRVQSTATDSTPDVFTITGGLSAVSSSIAIALLGGTQTATVTRAVNGVAKAQSAGAAVSLWRPAAIAL